ncbi:MAG: flagellin [Geminicoccaceae bacterium]
MLTGRIGDAGQLERLRQLMQGTQTRIRDAEVAVSSGKIAGGFDAIGRDTGMLLRARDARASVQAQLDETTRTGDRLRVTDGAVSRLADIAERLRSLLVQRLDSSSGALVPLADEAASMLDDAESQLNTQLDGRYLFAGSRTDAPAVDIPDAATAADPALYYKGDGVRLSVRADTTTEIAYGVTADDPAIADLLAALGQAVTADQASDRSGLEAALDRAGEAVKGLAELRGGIGATQARVESAGDRHRDTSLYLDEIISRIEDTDLASAMSSLAQDRASLEASYLVTSTLSKLSLVDYLR